MEKRKPYTPPDERQLGIFGLRKALIEEAQDDLKLGHAKDLLNLGKKLTGTGKSIAFDALKYGRISDKQGYALAAQLVDAGLVHHSNYVDYGKEGGRK